MGRSENADDDDENSDGEDDLEGQLGLDGGMDDGSFSIQATPQREGDSIGFIGLFFRYVAQSQMHDLTPANVNSSAV
jgi:hypothetical protein